MTGCAVAKSYRTFRPEHLIISPQSFPLSRLRRVWTWPIVLIGRALLLARRGLAKLSCVNLAAQRMCREYVSVDHEGDVPTWDDEVGRYYILVPSPLNRRERLLALLERLALRLWRVNANWQSAQLATLVVCDIKISKISLPGHIRLSSVIDTFIRFEKECTAECTAGSEIEIEVHNGNRRECQLKMALLGEERIDE